MPELKVIEYKAEDNLKCSGFRFLIDGEEVLYIDFYNQPSPGCFVRIIRPQDDIKCWFKTGGLFEIAQITTIQGFETQVTKMGEKKLFCGLNNIIIEQHKES